MQYTENELAKLIETVEKEFTVHLNKAEQLAKSEGAANSAAPAPLAKAEDEKPEKKADESKPEDKKDEKSAESKDEAPKGDEKAAAPAAEAKPDAKEDGAPAAPAAEGAPAAAGAGEACDYDEEDLQHMHKMYSSMSKGELKAHHDSVRRALDSSGMQKCGDMSMSKSEDTSTAKPADAKPIEVTPEVINETKTEDVLKSELAKANEKVAQLEKTQSVLQEFLTKLVGKTAAPKGKAITEVAAIAKSEGADEVKELSKSEVTQVLMKKASDPSLSKADREAINSYYLGERNFNTISHLLKN